ncbi:MAG: DUF5063 domain-containing protein [Bacteroidales bacterium]|nr:DUF5063 domain-containing protein [Bacteroidales bacterium]
MNDIPDHPVYSKNVLEFITVAYDYSVTLKKKEKFKKNELIHYLRKVLPLLYVKADLIPDTEVRNPDANERFVTEEEWEALFNQLRNLFGADDEFWLTDPSGNESEMVKGSMAEHLTDIWQDLQDFLVLYQKNSIMAKENAVFEVKRLFNESWGIRLVNALKQLHFLGMKPVIDTDHEMPDFF